MRMVGATARYSVFLESMSTLWGRRAVVNDEIGPFHCSAPLRLPAAHRTHIL
jgi:hypothetical protein